MLAFSVSCGGIIGSGLFLVIGSLLGMDYSVRGLLVNGFSDGAFYVFIWAPGASLIACVMLAFHRPRSDFSSSDISQ
jgi:hypothetical protein